MCGNGFGGDTFFVILAVLLDFCMNTARDSMHANVFAARVDQTMT